ncbi:virulence factor secretion apparatus protein [Burkholderia sp. WAC0059]|uniref:Hcp family type VI secretion system effector n=1 Tax=Burkholderia sp. WAC0059 TaxID=2066022 RepID=UPI000C7EECCB|nr:type VI secretion system tube protein Hcp [Burkholderia sp. WAC0059]PLY99969.1 virulence factor secretion apparatus protein [Burkholderia sp. WAC0059]
MDTILLELKNIKGNSMIDGYADKVLLDSFSLGVSLPLSSDPANTERTLGRPNFSEFNCSKATDQSTPAFYAACAEGSKLGDATIYVGRNEAGKFMPLLKYVLSNAMVSSIQTGGGGSMASDSLSFAFTQITAEYTQQGVDSTKKGTASFGWDLAKNTSVSASKT